MREYKFRGKRKDNGEWVYGYYLKSATAFIAVDDGLVDGHFDLYEVDPETVGQFVGCYDKNGKKIFEGDLFKDSTGISLVTWNEPLASFCLRRNGWMYDHFFGEAINPEEGEVIGNRYENPELLTNNEWEQEK